YQQSDFLTLPSSPTSNPSKLDQLEEQLKYYRSKESEMNFQVKSIRDSYEKLNDENRRLQETPQIEIASLQEELTLVKMRDAETNVNLNELKQRVIDLNREWQIHEQKCKILLSDKQQQTLTPQEYDVVEHELLALKMREAQTDYDSTNNNNKEDRAKFDYTDESYAYDPKLEYVDIETFMYVTHGLNENFDTDKPHTKEQVVIYKRLVRYKYLDIQYFFTLNLSKDSTTRVLGCKIFCCLSV
ncbi:unnamed protein product, partial [Didymodactylos carnosus]